MLGCEAPSTGGLAPLGAREILGERGGSHAGKFIWGPKVGKMQHGLNVSERYVRGGNLASVRRSDHGKVFVLGVLDESVACGGSRPGGATTDEGECPPLGPSSIDISNHSIVRFTSHAVPEWGDVALENRYEVPSSLL